MSKKRILVVQFGNYAEAEHRFAQGGDETYYAQRYTVDYVAQLVAAGHEVRMVSLERDAQLERLPSGVESMGLQLYPGRFRRARFGKLIREVGTWSPTDVICAIPSPELLNWATGHNIRTLPLFADSFHSTKFRQKLSYGRLARALNHPSIRWVANHGPNAAADLVRIGVDGRKVVPFDWPALISAGSWPSKQAPQNPRTIRLVCVAMLMETKGIGDLLGALALAQASGDEYSAVLVGGGETQKFKQQAAALGLADRVEFAGKVAHSRVLELMHEGDVVVVPSRHEYPEGMPMTIFEGLSSRSPVVVSDHPMFRGRVEHRKSAMVFQASSAQSLLAVVRELVNDRELYESLSQNAETICANFFGPLKWDQLITRWLSASADDEAWLRQFALA